MGVVLLAAGAAGFSAGLVLDGYGFEGRLYPGIAIAGADVGRMTVQEAFSRAQAVVEARLSRSLVLRVEGEPVRFTYGQLGVQANVAEAVGAAYALGHSGSVWSRGVSRLRLARDPMNIPVHFARQDGAIDAFLTALAARLTSEPRDAEVTVRDGAVVLIQPSQNGRGLDVAATRERLIAALNANTGDVDAVVHTTAPRFTTADAQGLRAPVASFRTPLAPIPNRTHNIALAAGFIRGRLLAPGEVFSYNAAIGPTTPLRGFKEAPVLINDELIPGEGGGVCQVSSTLFNVALLADLQILARANHSRPVAYLPIGRDATVNSGVLDLRFRNTTGHYLLLWASVDGRSLTITAYGVPVAGREVSIIVADREELAPPQETLRKSDPELDAGQVVTREAQAGYRVKTYRVVKLDGQVVRRELIGISYYRPVPRTVKVGTKKLDRLSART